MNQTLTTEIDVRLISGTTLIPVRGVFHYDPADPYTVKVVFRVNGSAEAVEWVFGRDLVTTGITRETGQGDVRIWPAEEGSGVESVFFALSSPEGTALLECPKAPLATFLDQTYKVVEYGAEEDFLDLDDTIQKLLDGGI